LGGISTSALITLNVGSFKSVFHHAQSLGRSASTAHRRSKRGNIIRRRHGFTVAQMVEIVRAGLATAHSQRVIVGRRTIEIAHVKITEAGRQALA
jgi:hypothetical protein